MSDAKMLVSRLARTPLRDALRGRVTCRLDVNGAIAAAALPGPVAGLVKDVVRRTRLWRLERAEVADELIAHFVDGLAAGATPEALVVSFGDPTRAARLIRRAKKRNRPLPWRASRWTMIALGAMVVVYLGVGVRFYLGHAQPSVNYVRQLGETARRVPAAERAWPIYREALIGFGELPTYEELTRAPLPGEDGWSEAATFLADHATALETARRAKDLPALGFVVGEDIDPEDAALWPVLAEDQVQRRRDVDREVDTWDDSLISVLLPHLRELRKLGSALALDFLDAAASGDGARALADFESQIALARHLRETPVLIGDMVAQSIAAQAADTLGRALADHASAFTDEQLVALAHRLAGIRNSLDARPGTERRLFYDCVQRMYTDDGNGDGRLTLDGLRMVESLSSLGESRLDEPLKALGLPLISAVTMSRKDIVREYDRLMDDIEADALRPLWKRGTSRTETQIARWASSRLETARRLPIVFLLPAISRVSISSGLTRQRFDAASAAIAMELYRRRNGVWPSTLDVLVPDLLPSLPIDQYDGNPLRYVLRDGRPVLYSVGNDRRDGGGQPPPDDVNPHVRWLPAEHVAGLSNTTSIEGDWILWPAPLEPLLRRP